jgi:hypothetical protein
VVETEIRLTERELSQMPQELRERLLLWYVELREIRLSEEIAEDLKDLLDAPEETDRQIGFREFLTAQVIESGDELLCRKLKRHRKVSPAGEYIEGASMSDEGVAVFQGNEYSTPSQLAVAMANSLKAGERVKALNGYQYIYARLDDGTVYSLDWLRRRVVRKERFDQAKQYALRAIVAADNPVVRCPYCKQDRLQENRKELTTDSGAVTLVNLICGHTIASHQKAGD